MTSFPEKSVEELREHSERTREALAVTVTELRDRVGDTATRIKTAVSPAHIKQEIRDYARQERESVVEAVQRKAKENPLQMAAVAAAVGYPALGLLRALPAPLWLIGAGLFLTSKRGRRVAAEAKVRIDDVVQQGTERITDLAGSVRSDLEDRIAGARYGVEEAADAVTSRVGGMADQARAAFHDARDAASGTARETTSKANVTAERMSSSASKTADAMRRRADEMARTSRYAVTDFVQDNALLVAGVWGGGGGGVAASLTPSHGENPPVGARRREPKDKGRGAAGAGNPKEGEQAP